MGLKHAGLPVEDHWVKKLGDLYLIPCLAEDNIAFEYFVFKSSSEATFRSAFFHMLLNLTPDPTDCADLGAAKLGNLKLAVKHTLDESSVFVDLERLTDKL